MSDHDHAEKDALRHQLKEALRARVCSVCTGHPQTVDDCVCGGEGTQDAEMDGLRKEIMRLKADAASMLQSVDTARFLRDGAWNGVNEIYGRSYRDLYAQMSSLRLERDSAVARNFKLSEDISEEKAERVPIADFVQRVLDVVNEAIDRVTKAEKRETSYAFRVLTDVLSAIEALRGWTGAEHQAPSHYVLRSELVSVEKQRNDLEDALRLFRLGDVTIGEVEAAADMAFEAIGVQRPRRDWADNFTDLYAALLAGPARLRAISKEKRADAQAASREVDRRSLEETANRYERMAQQVEEAQMGAVSKKDG